MVGGSRVLSPETTVGVQSCNGDPRIFFHLVLAECSRVQEGCAIPSHLGI